MPPRHLEGTCQPTPTRGSFAGPKPWPGPCRTQSYPGPVLLPPLLTCRALGPVPPAKNVSKAAILAASLSSSLPASFLTQPLPRCPQPLLWSPQNPTLVSESFSLASVPSAADPRACCPRWLPACPQQLLESGPCVLRAVPRFPFSPAGSLPNPLHGACPPSLRVLFAALRMKATSHLCRHITPQPSLLSRPCRPCRVDPSSLHPRL